MYTPELLATFLDVVEELSFTAAGRRSGLSQPTVSQHIRRLEEQVGRILFVRDTRGVALTADGESLVPLAREILKAHQRAVEQFSGPRPAGRLRFGVTDDLALTPLPRILRNFRVLNPQVSLELTVLQNDSLLRRIESGHLDLAFAKRSGGMPAAAQVQVVRRDQWVWAGAHSNPDLTDPLPFVAYQSPSLSRSMSVQALEAAELGYRITCVARGVIGVLAAVRAGLGIAVFARSLLPSDLFEVPTSAELPLLPALDLVLLTNPRAPEQAASALTSAILSSGDALKPDGIA